MVARVAGNGWNQLPLDIFFPPLFVASVPIFAPPPRFGVVPLSLSLSLSLSDFIVHSTRFTTVALSRKFLVFTTPLKSCFYCRTLRLQEVSAKLNKSERETTEKHAENRQSATFPFIPCLSLVNYELTVIYRILGRLYRILPILASTLPRDRNRFKAFETTYGVLRKFERRRRGAVKKPIVLKWPAQEKKGWLFRYFSFPFARSKSC